VVLSSLLWGCVDTADPTGPVPTPPGDEGEFTSVVVTGAGVVDPAGGEGSRTRSSASR